MHKIVDGQVIELTTEEITLRETEMQTAEADRLVNEPFEKLQELDSELPRWAEDLAVHTGMALQGRAEEIRLLKEVERNKIQQENI